MIVTIAYGVKSVSNRPVLDVYFSLRESPGPGQLVIDDK